MPLLFCKPATKNATLNSLRETERHNVDRERKLKDKLAALTTKLHRIEGDMDLLEFKVKV